MRALAAGFFATAVACSSASTGKITSEETTGPPEEKEVPVLEVGRYAKVYRGDEGLRITIVKVSGSEQPGEPERSLIDVSGVESDIDGLVLLYEKVDRGRSGWAYKTIVRGEEYWTVHVDKRGEETKLRVYLPGNAAANLNATYDEEASRAVEPEALAKRHAELVADGTIARLQEFNREERRQKAEQYLAEEMAGAEKACEKKVPVAIDWSTISDEQLKDVSISKFCEHVGDAAAKLCEHPEGKALYQAQVKRIRCAFGEGSALALDKDGSLAWRVDPEGTNLRELTQKLIQPVFGRERVVLRSKSGVHLILSPGDPDAPIYYSRDGKTFYEHRESSRSSSSNHRYLFAGGQRGKLSFEDGAWKVSCGDREAKLEDLERKERQKILARAELKEQAWKRAPFVLARDDRGRYYYVDRLLDQYGGKGFRVFIGLKGKLELTRLMDIVDDSHGTIFATKDGDLRLLIDRNGATGKATWIRRKSRKQLTVLPPIGNSKLIYGALGVYAGESLGSVCEEI